MTPEEIAQKIIDDVPYSDEGSLYAGFPNLLWVQAQIAQAIRDAYECAAVVCDKRATERRAQADSPKNSIGQIDYFADIRALKESSPL